MLALKEAMEANKQDDDADSNKCCSEGLAHSFEPVVSVNNAWVVAGYCRVQSKELRNCNTDTRKG